jgi:hypothetical protein
MRKIVTLCGSYKSKSSFEEYKENIENDDCMVLMPDTITSPLSLNDASNEQLERIHSIQDLENDIFHTMNSQQRIMDEINKVKPKLAHNYVNNDSVFDPHMKEY